jgi:hypothetical protein
MTRVTRPPLLVLSWVFAKQAEGTRDLGMAAARALPGRKNERTKERKARAHPGLAPVDHPDPLVGDLEDAALGYGGLVGGVTDDPTYGLTDDARPLVREGLDGAEVTQEVALPLDLGCRRVEVAVVHVDGVGRGEDALAPGSQVHTLPTDRSLSILFLSKSSLDYRNY